MADLNWTPKRAGVVPYSKTEESLPVQSRMQCTLLGPRSGRARLRGHHGHSSEGRLEVRECVVWSRNGWFEGESVSRAWRTGSR